MVDRRSFNISPRDLEALSRLSYAEARTIKDERAYPSVVDSVMNRAAVGGWMGKDIQGVINAPRQYSPVNPFGSWTGLNAAPPSVSTTVASHLASQAFGAPQAAPPDAITGKPSTHFMNPDVAHTAPAKATWGKAVDSWGVVGQAPNAHAFGNPDNVSVPGFDVSLSEQVRGQIPGMYSPTNLGTSLAQPMSEAAPISTTAIGDTFASLAPGSVAGLGPAMFGLDPAYSTPPNIDTISTVPGAMMAEAPSAPSTPPSNLNNQAAVPSAMMSNVSSVANPMAHAVGGIPSAATAFGPMSAPGVSPTDPLGAPSIAGFSPGQFGPSSTVSAMSTTPQAAEPTSTPASPRSVTTVSMPGLNPADIGMAAPSVAAPSTPSTDIRGRIDAAFNAAPGPNAMGSYGTLQGMPGQATAMAPGQIQGRIEQAHALSPAPNSFSDLNAAMQQQSQVAKLSEPSLATPSPAQSIGLGTQPAFGAPVGMPSYSAPTMPGALSPMAGTLQPGTSVPGFGFASVAAPESPQMASLSQPQTAISPGMMSPNLSMTSMPAMSAPAPSTPAAPATPAAPGMVPGPMGGATVAGPQTTVAAPQDQQQRKAQSQIAPSVAPARSLTAGIDSALGVAAAMSQQASNAKAGQNPNANTQGQGTSTGAAKSGAGSTGAAKGGGTGKGGAGKSSGGGASSSGKGSKSGGPSGANRGGGGERQGGYGGR